MAERRPRIVAVFGEALAETVIDVLTLTEMAWHDCYGEISPPESIIDDILVCSAGELGRLIQAANLAVIDSRDLTIWAADVRGR